MTINLGTLGCGPGPYDDAPEGQVKPDPEVPAGILRTWTYVPAETWERLSEARWRAPHPTVPGFSECVVTVFGETIGQACTSGREDETFASLFAAAAKCAAHRESCANGTPIVRPNNGANRGVEGRCWWCGRYPAQHEPHVGSPADELGAVTRAAGGGRMFSTVYTAQQWADGDRGL